MKHRVALLTVDQYSLLETAYLKVFPKDITDEMLTYEGIAKYKHYIKYSLPDKRILTQLLDVAINRIIKKQRFQKQTFIKLIRWQRDLAFVDQENADKLFFIFKELIFSVNETLAWSLSAMLKDVKLSQSNIDYLINNYTASGHFLNRLLRYPIPNKAITAWAKIRLKKSELTSRKSELIALVLNYEPRLSVKDKVSLVWAVHYSKLQDEIKKEMLLDNITSTNFDAIIEICARNNFVDVISDIYNERRVSIMIDTRGIESE